jgi:hypothetical protein
VPSDNARLAVLIDADNTSPRHAGALLEEVARYGVPTVKRAYGDWTTPQLGGWKEELNRNAIVPVQQFAYTTGKNPQLRREDRWGRPVSGDASTGSTGSAVLPDLPNLQSILTKAINATSQDDGWTWLSAVGSWLSTAHPSFDPRNYGAKKLVDLVRAERYVEVEQTDSGPVKVRLKSRRKPQSG